MQPQILLAVADEQRRQRYEAFLSKERVICQTVSSLRDVSTQTAKQPYHAIFVDMPLYVRASHYQKSLAEDALKALPHARLNLTPSGEISILVSGEGHESSSTPEEYLHFCCQQPVKLVKPRTRIRLHINALFSHSEDFRDACRTACVDISAGGCFLFSTDVKVAPHDTVWVRLVNLNDQTPITSMVCWKREWGTSNEMPGVGIRFDGMTEDQQNQLTDICREKLRE